MKTRHWLKNTSLLWSAAALLYMGFSGSAAFANTVNLLKYTVGDGKTDDQAGIMQAFAAAGPGGTVIAPKGHTWEHSGVLNAPAGLKIRGGGVSSVFEATAYNGALVMTGPSPLVVNMTIRYGNVPPPPLSTLTSPPPQASDIFVQSGSNVRLQDLTLGHTLGSSVSNTGSSGLLVDNIVNNDSQNALHVVDCHNLEIFNNRINTGGSALKISTGTTGSKVISLLHNTLNLTGSASPAAGVLVSGANDVLVQDNLFNNLGSLQYDVWAAPLPANSMAGYGPITNMSITGNIMRVENSAASISTKSVTPTPTAGGSTGGTGGGSTNQNPVYYGGILVLPPGMALPSPSDINLVNGLLISGNTIDGANAPIVVAFASNVVVQENILQNVGEANPSTPSEAMSFADCGKLTVGGTRMLNGKVTAAGNIFDNVTGTALVVMQNFSGTNDPSNPVGAVVLSYNKFYNCYCQSGNVTTSSDPVWANAVIKVWAGAYPSVRIVNNVYSGPVNKNLQYFVDSLQPKTIGSGNLAPHWLTSYYAP